jgi:phosphoribosylformylglycinamidine synthase
MARVAVIQFPGTNCEFETLRAVQTVGLEGSIFRWNKDPKELYEFDAFILPGGFSYQDRIRAGAVAARKPLLVTLAELSDEGRPILGICNGAQVLVEAGLVPGGGDHRVHMALATNYVAGRMGYFCTWTTVKVMTSPEHHPFLCDFTEGETFPVPIAHGEGRFVTQDEGLLDDLEKGGQLVLSYCNERGEVSDKFPITPNGSSRAIAGVSSYQGNVLAFMPHPERAMSLFQIPETYPHDWARKRKSAGRSREVLLEPGPGLKMFSSLKRHLAKQAS